jgi:hypothetical protein
MATVLEVCITEEQSSVVRFGGEKESMQIVFKKKCFLFMVGSVCRLKRFTTESRNFHFDDAEVETGVRSD